MEIQTPSSSAPFPSGVTVEEVAQYYNTKPCNLSHSPAEIGSKEFFDQVEQRKYFVEPHIPQLAEFQLWRGKKVLDIGCGLGTESLNFARQGAEVHAIDVSDRSLELTKKRFEVYGLKGHFYLGNAEELSSIIPSDVRFDLIWSFGMLHTTPCPEKVVQEMKRLLAPHGELRLMVYSRVSYNLFNLMQEKQAWDFSKIHELLSLYCQDQVGTPITNTFTLEGVRSLLADFDTYFIEKDHIFKYKVKQYKEYIYEVEDRWASLSEEQFKKLEKELGWHTLIKARLPRSD